QKNADDIQVVLEFRRVLFRSDLSIGYIPIDSVHTPIKKVNYSVEATRQGSNTEFDKLTIEVWTDGSVKPDDSIGIAAKIVKDHRSEERRVGKEHEDSMSEKQG